MAKKRTIKAKKGKKGGASMMAKGAGLLAGGAVGLAAGTILADEDRREKIVKTVGALANQAVDMVEEMTDDTANLRDRAYKSLGNAQDTKKELAKKTKKLTDKN